MSLIISQLFDVRTLRFLCLDLYLNINWVICFLDIKICVVPLLKSMMVSMVITAQVDLWMSVTCALTGGHAVSIIYSATNEHVSVPVL